MLARYFRTGMASLSEPSITETAATRRAGLRAADMDPVLASSRHRTDGGSGPRYCEAVSVAGGRGREVQFIEFSSVVARLARLAAGQ